VLNSNKTNPPVAGSSLFVSLSKWKLCFLLCGAQLNKFCVRRERFLLGNTHHTCCERDELQSTKGCNAKFMHMRAHVSKLKVKCVRLNALT
jgi:hypothetical protein